MGVPWRGIGGDRVREDEPRRGRVGDWARRRARHGGGAGMSQVEIPASLVKELRDRTGAGMMDAKRALEETGGDVEAAQRLLREQGMAAARRKAGPETTQGGRSEEHTA